MRMPMCGLSDGEYRTLTAETAVPRGRTRPGTAVRAGRRVESPRRVRDYAERPLRSALCLSRRSAHIALMNTCFAG